MIVLLAVGFVANELIRPVNPVYHEPPVEEAGQQSPLAMRGEA